MNVYPYLIGWAVLAAVVGGLALYRRSLADHEDDSIHLNAGADAELENQQATIVKLQKVDRLGIRLTIIVAVWGLALLAYYLWQAWLDSYKSPE